ncbi:hypothetical protein AT251_01075 [Enterovibrio nigricans]|nr:hypothetical protein AT251_01075 [Enterovibrio nigricans]
MLAHGKDLTLIWVYSKRESGLPLLNNQEAAFSKMEIREMLWHCTEKRLERSDRLKAHYW